MNQKELQDRLTENQYKHIRIEQTAANRFYLTCESEKACAVSRFLFEDIGCRFVIITGIDNDNVYEVLYHFSYDLLGCIITVKAILRNRENPEIESITPFVPGAEWIEREVHDILGFSLRNHPNLRRLILADDWPEGVYPMRKEVQK